MQVLDELGIQMGEEMGGLVVPSGQIGAAEKAGVAKVPIGGEQQDYGRSTVAVSIKN